MRSENGKENWTSYVTHINRGTLPSVRGLAAFSVKMHLETHCYGCATSSSPLLTLLQTTLHFQCSQRRLRVQPTNTPTTYTANTTLNTTCPLSVYGLDSIGLDRGFISKQFCYSCRKVFISVCYVFLRTLSWIADCNIKINCLINIHL